VYPVSPRLDRNLPERPRHKRNVVTVNHFILEMWANAQRGGRPAEYRWRPLFNAAKFGSRPLLDAVQ